MRVLEWLGVLLLGRALAATTRCTGTSTSSSSTSTTSPSASTSTSTGRYGVCSVPILTRDEDNPLLVIKTVTSTRVILTTNVNSLTVGGPVFTDTTTVVLRTTLTSTEVSLTTTVTVVTIVATISQSTMTTRTVLNNAVEYSPTFGTSVLTTVSTSSTRTTTQIFTSYTISTISRTIALVSRSTDFILGTTTVIEFVRSTEFILVTYSFTPLTTIVNSTTVRVITVPPTDSFITPTFTTSTVIITTTTGPTVFTNTFSFTTLTTNPVLVVGQTLTRSLDYFFTGQFTGTLTINSPVVTLLINS